MNIIKDFIESNRWKHFLVSFAGSAILGIGFAVGANLATEYKDKTYGTGWDNKDLIYGMFGGIAGQLVQSELLHLIIK